MSIEIYRAKQIPVAEPQTITMALGDHKLGWSAGLTDSRQNIMLELHGPLGPTGIIITAAQAKALAFELDMLALMTE